MKKKSLIITLLLVVSTILAVNNNAQAKDRSTAGKRLAVAHITMSDEWCSEVADEFEKQSKDRGFAECNVQDGNHDHETQLKQMENFIIQEYDIIMIDPINPEGLRGVFEKAEREGIPVLSFDSSPKWDKIVSHVAWDHALTGEMIGEYTLDYVKKNLGGKATVAILDMPQFPHVTTRAAKFKEIIKANPDIKILYEQDFQGNREIAANIVSNFKEPVDLIVSTTDNGAWGAVSALEAKGITKTKVFSCGGWGAEPFDALKANHPIYTATVGVPPAGIAMESLEIAEDYFDGDKNKIPARKDIELLLLDSSNIATIW